MKARFPHSTWGATKTSTSTQHLMAQLSMWTQETLLWVSLWFPIYVSVQVCTHPDRSKTVRWNPERLRKSSTAVIPYYVHIYSQVRGWCMMLHVCYASAGCSMYQSSPSQEKLHYTSDKFVHPHDDGVFVGSAQLGRVVPDCTGLFGWEKNKAFHWESCY